VQHYLLSEAARHPAASWTQVQTLIDHAIATQVTDEAIALLSDWLDDPPTPHDPKQINAARRALANLHLTAKQPDEAAKLLAPLIQNQAQPDLDALDLAWTIAGLTQNPTPLIAPIESLLRRYPQHQLNWRELSLTPAPDPTYLLWLDRLTNACTQTQQDARAVELGLHLATLHSPAKLLPILPAAARADRFPEVLELLDRLEKSAASANQASPTLTLAETCYQQQDIDSARRLLEHRLKQTPAHLPTLRLSLQVKSHALPPMQAAILWRRHLQQHPDDLFAHQLLVDAWLAAHQPSAAVNHLLATDSSRLDTDLRLRTAQLALENRQNAAFPRAIQRLLDAKDPIPAESLSLWTQHLQALKLPTLATALQMD
jgi:predicted Zn-dependent protease